MTKPKKPRVYQNAIVIRLPKPLQERLKAKAEESGMSLNGYCVAVLETSLAELLGVDRKERENELV